jgi:hypothetical protein
MIVLCPCGGRLLVHSETPVHPGLGPHRTPGVLLVCEHEPAHKLHVPAALWDALRELPTYYSPTPAQLLSELFTRVPSERAPEIERVVDGIRW